MQQHDNIYHTIFCIEQQVTTMNERRFHTPIENGSDALEQDSQSIPIEDPLVLRLLTMYGEDEIPKDPGAFLTAWNDHTSHNPIVFTWDREQLIDAIGALEPAAQFRRKDRERSSEELREAQRVFQFVLTELRHAIQQYDTAQKKTDDGEGVYPVVDDSTDDLLQTVGEGEVGRESFEVLQHIGRVAGRDVERFLLPPVEYVHLERDGRITAQHLKRWYSLGTVKPGKAWRVPGSIIIGVYIAIPFHDGQHHARPLTVYHRFTDSERQAIIQATRGKPAVIGRSSSVNDEEVLRRQEHRILIRPDEIESGEKEEAKELISRRHMQLYFHHGRLHVHDLSRNHGIHIVLPKTEETRSSRHS